MKLPYILAAARYPGVESNFVMSDDALGGYLAAKHLCQLGHRRFALVFHEAETSPVLDRIAGFERGLRECGLDPAACVRRPLWEKHILEPDAVAAATRHLLRGPRDFTAVFCYCDYFAMSVYAEIYQAGLRIPEDVSVMGYDNIHLSSAMWPLLSTVNIDHEELGEIAARELLELIYTPYADIPMRRQIVLRPSLVLRASTAPPPAGK